MFCSFEYIYIDIRDTGDKVFCGFSSRSSSKALLTRPISGNVISFLRALFCFLIQVFPYYVSNRRQTVNLVSAGRTRRAIHSRIFRQRCNFHFFQKNLQKCPLAKFLHSDWNCVWIISRVPHPPKIKFNGQTSFCMCHIFTSWGFLSTRNISKQAHVMNKLGALGAGFTTAPVLLYYLAMSTVQ